MDNHNTPPKDQTNLADNLFTDTLNGILDDDVIGNTLADIQNEQSHGTPTEDSQVDKTVQDDDYGIPT